MKKRIHQFIIRTCATTIMILAAAGNVYPQAVTTGSKVKLPAGSSSQDIEIIRKRIIDDLLEPDVNTPAIKKLITTIKADGSWPDINYKDTSRTGFQHREHLEHMVDLGRAYKKQGSPYYQDMNVIQAVFYKAGKIQVANNLAVTAESPCMVLIEMDGKQIKKMWVSDPTQLLKKLEFKISAPVKIIGKKGIASWNQESKFTTIEVELPKDGDAGKSIDLDFEQ